ncbi:glycogen debranching protein GlgX [Oxalobacteraceae bacterium OM1]|nr:glycogen debranching protein GlgX [Oxalobacteraceae bacterium OM1]
MHSIPLPLPAVEAGSPYPLGATYDGNGTNFAVFSAHATAVELCLFDAAGKHELARCALPECTDEVWHGYLPGIHAGVLYGYRAYGPYQPELGHRFNPNKLLLDPYAKLIQGEVRWNDTLYGYRMSSPRADLSFDHRDSAPSMPKAVVTSTAYHWYGDRPPATPWEKTIIYEAHVRGMTMQNDKVQQRARGTFAGLAHASVIDHLVNLGVTAVELLPVHAFLNDRRLLAAGLVNYWGYNTLGFFAPHRRYLSSGSPDELRHAVRKLHAAGIEVILDVVYNHTCEESELGPTLSFRGLDNASYYRLQEDNPRHCVNDTGTGNTLNLTHPRVIQLVMDSLRHWVEDYHIDGFRFDLGATLGRERHGFDPGAGFFDALLQDPVLARVKLISEPWDIGPGGYQVGRHPPGLAEWNDRFRDDVRSFWRGDDRMRGAVAGRLLGSADLFNHHRRRAWSSVNFVTAHDGFTLQDLVSYNHKHNEANREDNRDGSSDNRSCNWGVEGPTDDPHIRTIRERIKRAMLMTLLFSSGTPMLLAGDELGRTQQGNNNPYCQDTELSWFDWSLADTPEGRALLDFTRRCIAVRKSTPALHTSRFVLEPGRLHQGVPDVAWFDETGTDMTPERWEFPGGRLLALRRIVRQRGRKSSAFLLLLNASGDDRDFALPAPHIDWQMECDAAETEWQQERSFVVHHNIVHVRAHSAVLLTANHVDL